MTYLTLVPLLGGENYWQYPSPTSCRYSQITATEPTNQVSNHRSSWNVEQFVKNFLPFMELIG
jgi:hypothetical protein